MIGYWSKKPTDVATHVRVVYAAFILHSLEKLKESHAHVSCAVKEPNQRHKGALGLVVQTMHATD